MKKCLRIITRRLVSAALYLDKLAYEPIQPRHEDTVVIGHKEIKHVYLT